MNAPDKHGRRLTVILSGLVTPLGLLLLLAARVFGFLSLDLILCTNFVMGLFYATRASTAYLYASEVLPSNCKLKFGMCLFCVDGITTMLTACFFRYVAN